MSDETKEEVPMAECGACRAIVPLNSENCPECNISFTGVSDEALGECGACQGLVPLDSTKCPHCGTIFVADDVVEVLRKWLETTGISIPTLFKKFDTNNDNLIDSSELKTGLLSLNLADLPPSQVERLVNTIDEDGDGQIDLSELHETITGVEYESEEIDQPSTDTEPEKDDSVDEVDGDSDEDEKPLENTDEDSDEGSEMDDSMEDSMDVDPDEEDDDVLESDEVEDEPVVESEEIEDFEDEELDEGYVAEMDDVDEIDNEIQSPQSILQLISDAMDESGDSPNKFFNALDNDGNGQISAAEFKESISDLIGSEVTHKDIESFLSDADEDNDGTIDIIEFVEILESLDDTDDAIDDEARLSKKVDKPFPTDLQRKMMGKKWNDVVWPLIHMTFGLFIAAWLINGMGGIGPLSVSGEGGPIALETSYKIGYESWEEGDIYPCEPDVQVGECRNSLTPLSGDSSSMPAGFYWDGILMMVLGTVGLLGSLAMHFVVVPGWRARSKAMKEVSDDTDEARTENSNDEDDAEPEADVEEEADDGEELDDEEEVFDDEEDDESEDDEDEDADGDDEIDIGSHIGLAFEDEDVFGTIIEFDDEEETVTIEEDGSGDLVTGYQKDIFLE
ncbi:EF-hand domain-containing protein [Euryarchaeota archaeon]|nr:EF-hand domain-containing protein [Euryarchaeota archaeon]MDA9156320.1 EF-hand domain-containing protein [Candidatus Poseidoniaceae archaeon]